MPRFLRMFTLKLIRRLVLEPLQVLNGEDPLLLQFLQFLGHCRQVVLVIGREDSQTYKIHRLNLTHQIRMTNAMVFAALLTLHLLLSGNPAHDKIRCDSIPNRIVTPLSAKAFRHHPRSIK
jgi:hypothetical protein